MASEPGDRNSIRIGGDAAGPVVAGRGNRVTVHQPKPGDLAESTAAGETPTPDSLQTNTASGHGTVFTVMHGDMHIHHDDDPLSDHGD